MRLPISVSSRLARLAERVAGARALLLLAALNAAFVVGAGRLAERWVHPPAGPTIVELELSFSGRVFADTLTAWARYGAQPPRSTNALANHFWGTAVLDTLVFPPLYLLLFLSLYANVARVTGRARDGHLERLPLYAVLCDLLENAGLLAATHFALGLEAPDLLPALARRSFPAWLVAGISLGAAVKFLLLFLSLAASAILWLRSDAGRVLRTCRFSALSVLIGSLPLIVASQGQDIVRALAGAETAALEKGLALGMLLLWAASVWYWARVLLTVAWDEAPPEDAARERHASQLIPRALGTLTLLLAGVAFLVGATTSTHARELGAFGVVCLVLAWGFHQAVTARRRTLQGFGWSIPAWPPPPVSVPSLDVLARSAPEPESLMAPLRVRVTALRRAWAQLPRGTRRAARASCGASLFFLAMFTFFPVWWGQRLGTMAVLLMAAANAVFLGSATLFVARVARVPVVTLAVLAAAVFSTWNDNHGVRALRHEPARPREPLGAAFDGWVAPLVREAAQRGRPAPVILVVTEGGGIRAAYWTATVLARLEDLAPRFSRHVFAISGVSGGSLGAAVFGGLVADRAAGTALPCAAGAVAAGVGASEACSRAILGHNFLGPTLAKMLAPDFTQWFTPFPVGSFDRARALADSWSEAYQGATGSGRFGRPFPELRPTGSTLPVLMLNAAHVQTGRRMLHSHVGFDAGEVPDTYDLARVLDADLSLADAVHDSARFAYVSPAGLLRSRAGSFHGHVVDGGYFENSGAATARDVLVALAARLDQDSRAHVRFLVLYLCNSPSRCYGAARAQPDDVPRPRPAGLTDLFAPVRALLGARQARGSLALEDLRHELQALPGPGGALVELGICPELADARKAPLPLGWQLSEQVRRELETQVAAKCAVPPAADEPSGQVPGESATPRDDEARAAREQASDKGMTIECLAWLVAPADEGDPSRERDCRSRLGLRAPSAGAGPAQEPSTHVHEGL